MITAEQKNAISGTGIAYPIQFSVNGQAELLTLTVGSPLIHQSIHTILATRIGERYNNIEFGCFTGETLIPLLSGTEVPIRDLVGTPSWVYGIYNGFVRPVQTTGAISRGVQPVIRVGLDNGKEITCTLNHLFLMRDGTYLPANKLKSGDSLMPL